MNNWQKSDSQIQVKFLTKQEKYAVPDTPFYVPHNVTPAGLNELLNQLLCEGASDSKNKKFQFSFLINDEILHSNLAEYIAENNISSEHDICIEYIEATPAPEPLDCLEHDDWVSAVHMSSEWILSGCYDNSLHIWSGESKHKHLLSCTSHSGPIKGVSWIQMWINENGNSMASFVSVSQDQTALLWEWNIDENVAKPIFVYRGHERSINCVHAKPSESVFVTGGWDCTLKIWLTDFNAINNEEELSAKRHKRDRINAPLTQVPKSTLQGHKEAISTVQWTEDNDIMSASWDHTIKLWDAEYGGIKTEIVGNKSIFNAHYSHLNHLIITCSADRHIRLYDSKSSEGSIVKKIFSSHKEWVQSVRWSTTAEHLFVSGSFDNDLKLWDIRSCNTPLFDLLGHEDKILCCDWSKPELIISGSADRTLRLYSVK
ncbi:hypothetical protein PGB90_009643 [Kerria lacca]